MAIVRLNEVIEKLNLDNLTPDIDVSRIKIRQPDINRPAVQMTGFFEHFAAGRMQVIGLVEYSYMQQMSDEQKESIYSKFLAMDIPCVVFCRELEPDETFCKYARLNGVPLLMTRIATSNFMAEVIRWLNVRLAPCITIHGVLVDVYGVGVLITGESGVGKSEAALELVKRGHQLVADDVVDICKVSDDHLTGESPEMVRHLMEIRGIGIIDIKAMYGISAVLMSKTIDLVIHLENWKEKKAYDRLGLAEDFTTIMDVRVPHVVLPVRPGRNLAVVIEVAARNFSLKQLGYSAAQELDRRLNEMMNARK